MAHPKDRPGVTRRQLLHGAAGGVVAVGAGGLLAGCQNTTTPIGACEGGGLSPLVEPKPTGPGGLPLPRPDNSVTWAITDDNQPIADGRQNEGGTLRVYNYADYLDPVVLKRFQKRYGVKVEIATYNSADEAIAKLAAGAVSFDIIVGLSGSNIVNLIAQQLLQPLNHSYLPNLERNVWPELQDPAYDRGSRFTAPYVAWSDGIGWRNDKIREEIAAMDVPWDIFWHSQAYRGKVAILADLVVAPANPVGPRDVGRREAAAAVVGGVVELWPDVPLKVRKVRWLSGCSSCWAMRLTMFEPERPTMMSKLTAPATRLRDTPSSAELYVAISTLTPYRFWKRLVRPGRDSRVVVDA